MPEQLKAVVEKIKEYWAKLSEKTRKIVKWAALGILALSLVLTVVLHTLGQGYKVIFPGMSNTEATQVYATLLEMGVQPQIDNTGNVRVPADQWDELQYQLSAQGYPKTTLSYDTFSSMSGFTTTEFEKRVALVYQLQDSIRTTLCRWDGIADATVTINIPEDTNFVWNQGDDQSSASVSVTMRPGYSLSPEQVSAIKNHTASAVPKLTPDRVTVTDSATGVEPPSLENSRDQYNVKRLEFERQIEKAIEDNVKRLLVPTYGAEGVTAGAKVIIDYDKMVTEIKEIKPQEDGEGVVSHREEHYESEDGAAGGIAGEENNTDLPQYPNLEGLAPEDLPLFDRVTDYEIGYIMTQIEKGEPLLKEASVAVIVDERFLSPERESLLQDLVSKGAGIPAEQVRVASLTPDDAAMPADASPIGLDLRRLLIIGGIALGAVVLILVVILVVTRRARRKRRMAEAQAAEEEENQRKLNLEREIDEHKRMLQEEAKASANPKENAITQEIREFAERNPEITANLIRSLMREDR